MRYNRRLQALCKWVGILSDGEASCALSCYREGNTYCCEAVANYGGPEPLIRRAVEMRHKLRSIGVI